MSNKVKMSEFDLWELRVKCVIWVFNGSSKNFQSYWFSDKKKGFLQNIYFFTVAKNEIIRNELGLVKNCQNIIGFPQLKLILKSARYNLGLPSYPQHKNFENFCLGA